MQFARALEADLHVLQQGQMLLPQVSWAIQPLLTRNDQSMAAGFWVCIIDHNTVRVNAHLWVLLPMPASCMLSIDKTIWKPVI